MRLDHVAIWIACVSLSVNIVVLTARPDLDTLSGDYPVKPTQTAISLMRPLCDQERLREDAPLPPDPGKLRLGQTQHVSRVFQSWMDDQTTYVLAVEARHSAHQTREALGCPP